MKGFSWILSFLTLLLCGLFVFFDLQLTGLPTSRPVLIPTGLQGELPIPEKEFTPILDKAKQEMTNRFASAGRLRDWSRILGWIAIGCSVFVTLVAGFLGKTIKPDNQAPPTIADVFGEQQKSKKMVRIISVLIALATACSLVSNRLESDAKTYAAAAVELNKAVIKTTETLYDTNTNIVKARVVLAELQGVMVQQ